MLTTETESTQTYDSLIEASLAMVARFEERLGARFVGAGIGGSALSGDMDSFADIDVLIVTHGASERWRIPDPHGAFDVFVIDMDKLDMSGRSPDYDHLLRLLANLRMLRDANGTVRALSNAARERLQGRRTPLEGPSFTLYAMVFDLQRKLRRAVASGDSVEARLRSALVVWNAARLLIIEHRGWLDGDYLAVLQTLDPTAAKLARQALLESDALAGARKALIFVGHVLRKRAGVETATLWRRTGAAA